ncbi:MAG: NUDIX domain-containing protein [Woeseiaceae bacterium]|nr:NUDIX domain-containing protein [Woeseiaceae bacterium]
MLALYCRAMIEAVAHWPSGRVRIEWHGPVATEMPVTGAHGFCFHDGRVLVCEIPQRGLTIPGGHIDEGESPADCLVREASEEASVDLTDLKLLGFIEADHRQNRDFAGQYPMRSVQAIYRANVDVVHAFGCRHESTRRQFVEITDLPSVHHEWNAVLQAALDAALESVQPEV